MLWDVYVLFEHYALKMCNALFLVAYCICVPSSLLKCAVVKEALTNSSFNYLHSYQAVVSVLLGQVQYRNIFGV